MFGIIKRYSLEFRSNYFELEDSDFNDSLTFNSVLDGSFDDYREEVSSQLDEFQVVCSNFSFSLPLTSELRSDNGLTAKEFLKPTDNTPYLYAVSLNTGAKELGGKIANEYTAINKSFMDGKWQIDISVFTWEKEFSGYCVTPLPLGGPLSIDFFIENYLLKGGENTGHRKRWFTDLNFDWDTRLGFTPVLIVEAYNQMLANGISETGWTLFKELAFGLGFIFKFQTKGLDPENNNFLKVILWTGWRSIGINHREIQMIGEHIETTQDLANKFIALFYRQDIGLHQINDAYRFSGIMKNKDTLYINDGQNVSTNFRDFLTVDARDFDSRGVRIQCKNLVRNLEDPNNPFPFDKTPVSSVKQIHRIYYYIDRGGDISAGTANKYYFVNSYSKVGSDYETSTVAFCRLFVKDYILRPLPSPVLGSSYYEIRDEGFYDQLPERSLIQKTAGVEYDFLIAGNKNIINTDIHFNSNMAIEIFDTVTVNDVDYWIRRIDDIDLSFEGQRASLELVQI